MPQTPMRGLRDSRAHQRVVRAPMTRSTSGASMRSMASSRPMCVVTWITRSFGATSIIETSGVSVSAASNSV